MGKRRTYGRVEAVLTRVLEAAAADHGVITARDLREAGLSKSVAAERVRTGAWDHPADGVYTVVGSDGGPFQDIAVALRSAGAVAFAQRLSAAKLHGGFDRERSAFGEPDVAVPSTASNRRYPRRNVPEAHIQVVHGLRTTDALQTLLDLAAVCSDLEWEWALEWALRHRYVTIDGLEALLLLPGRKDRSAADRVRRVLDLRPAGVPPTDSALETRFVQLCRRFGIDVPTRQHEVRISPTVSYFLDISWPEVGVFVELDGKGHDDQPLYDARRQTLVAAKTGWLCARLTWREVVRNPTPTARTVKALLAEGAAIRAARERQPSTGR